MDKDVKNSILDSLKSAVSYEVFRETVDRLALIGGTTGPEQKPALINYTKLNSRRLKRWDKTFRISEEHSDQIKKWGRKVIWLVITESWCGDAAPTMPVMNKIARLNPNIQLRVVLRDEHPELMNHFLTENARSIPKLIMIDAITLEVLEDWGPRPSRASKMAADYKMEYEVLSPQFKEELQQWYNKDKGENTLQDLMELLALENVSDSAFLRGSG